ncbi:hypothetical protein ACH4RA_34565 [Streptomyces smyrnaeus]|uniref:hypothetical protein n=1 Tax=Streptomyces TaxID=1883 RepID=UPI000C179F98|nr:MULTISPECIES: hypothetical protein [unclassified Streptomyces]MBQ0867442.1 hypothetical protein [Streptomyces sp. RK75]MBQ1122457.1 hypothetical protein [Streptomyces sp. B15]MBQ1162329.1 hypothetical protein [Streptomyces sp. A73]
MGKKVAVAILVVLALLFVLVQCQADSGSCSDDSRGATTVVAAAAFSPAESGGTYLSKPSKPVKPSKSDGGRGGFFGIFIFGDNDCD